MTWWQIVLLVYFGINFIIAMIVIIVFKGLGYFDDYYDYKTKWGKLIVTFIGLLIIGLPIGILRLLKWLMNS